MTPSRILRIIVAVLLALAVAFGAYAILKRLRSTSAAPTGNETGDLPVVTEDPDTQFANFMKLQETMRKGAIQTPRFDVQGTGGVVSVKNFYPDSFFVLDTTDVTIEQGLGFTLSYDRETHVFTIIDYAISREEFEEIRPRSEEELLRVLDISRADACKLTIIHYIPTNPEESGYGNAQQPFSGCLNTR